MIQKACSILFVFLSLCLHIHSADFILYVSGNNNLTLDAETILSIVSSHPQSSSNRIIASIKTQSTNTFIVRGKGTAHSTILQDADYGLPATLSQFLTNAESYRTDDISALVLWGHGTSWYPENTSSADMTRAIARDSLNGNALFFDRATESVVFKSRYTVVVTDACHYTSAETIYAFRNTAQIFIGSGHLIPSNAFNYSTIFSTAYVTENDVIDAFFNTFSHYSLYSLSAIRIPDFCEAIENFIHNYPLSSLDRTDLLGIDGNDTYSNNTLDIDLHPFFPAPTWLIRSISSDTHILGISLFFPPDYTYLKQYFDSYRQLSLQSNTDWLTKLSLFYGKDEIAPIIETLPELTRFRRSLRISPFTWYDTGFVTPTLIGVEQESKIPLLYSITNNSGNAGTQSGVIKINCTDSVQFTHNTWTTEGYLHFAFSFILRYSDTLVIEFENAHGWSEYGRYKGTGSHDVFFPSGTTRVRFFIQGTIALPLYKGVEITDYLSSHIQGTDHILSSQTEFIPDFIFSSYYLSLVDASGNITIRSLPVDTSAKNQIRFFPNPTRNGIIYFDATYNSVLVYTSTGKKILSLERTNSVDLSHFASGIYYIVLDGSIIKVISL